MTRRASVNRRGSIGRVLRDVRRNVEVAEIVDELTHIIRLVGAEREPPANGARSSSRSIVPVAGPSSASTTSPWRFSVIALQM
jgi:hypothetical protein